MNVTELKHHVKLKDWQERIMECRSQGITVAQWCQEYQVHKTTYYRWEREIFGSARKKDHGDMQLAAAPVFAELSAPQQVFTMPDGQKVAATVRLGTVVVDIYAGADAAVVEALCRGLKSC
mgnify:CR=1 FL=1